jgi:serine/threonine-protein kinase HipA
VENLGRCIDLCENRARSRQNILTWVLFNLLTGNADAHLKNLSFRMNPGGIELAPFYDLVSTESYSAEHGSNPRWPDRALSMEIGEAKTFAAVTRKDFFAFADRLGVNPCAATRLIDQYIATIGQAADELIREFETINVPSKVVRAGQLRVLRSIRFTIIRDMLERLGPTVSPPNSPSDGSVTVSGSSRTDF